MALVILGNIDTEERRSVSDGALIPLNRSEHLYWAGEGYLGSINQPYLLRLDRPVEEALVRQTLRELTSAFPRLRAVMEPTLTTYKLRILPDDRIVEQLFNDAYRIQRGVDASSREELHAFHTEFINEPSSLERGLPWRARFIDHPEKPALLFAVHHIVGDGRSMVQMLSAIMARLSGQAITPCPLQSSSMVPAVTPLHWWQWPASIAAWWRNSRRDAREAAGQQVVTLAHQASPRFTTVGIRYHELPGNQTQLRATAKELGTTVNTLMLALVANTFLARDQQNPNAVAAIRISVDLRRYFPQGQQPEFGNFVSSFTVRATHQATLADQLRSIEAQVKDHMGRYERRDYALPLMLYEWLPLVGRTLFSHLIVKSQAKGSLPPLSCHFSNLGSVEAIHPAEPQVRIAELWPTTLSTVFIVGLVSLNGKLFFTSIHQQAEIEEHSVTQFLAAMDAQLQELAARPSA